MAITDRFRNLIGGVRAYELLQPLWDDGVWPRGGLQRYVCQGIPKDVLEGFQDGIKTADDWDGEFSDAAVRYRVFGDKHKNDDTQLASRYYLISAACAFHAQILRSVNSRREAALRHKCRAAFALAAEMLHPPAQSLQTAFQSEHLQGYFRAAPDRPRGTVVLLNSQQSCKEDMYYFTQPLLDVGLNTLLVDTPGTGTALPRLTYTGVTGLWKSLQAALAKFPGTAEVPTLLFGAGLGGAVALHLLAKHPTTFRAAALLSPPHDLRAVADRLKPWVRNELCAFLGCEDEKLAEALGLVNCAGLGRQISVPILVVGGAKDRDFPKKQSRSLADELGKEKAEYWGSGSGSHCLYEKQPQLRQRLAQWLGRQVGSTTGREDFTDTSMTQPGE